MADPHARTGTEPRSSTPVRGRSARTGADKPTEKTPWRVEGERDGGSGSGPDKPARGAGGMPRVPGSRRFWRFLLVLLILNILLAQLIPSSEDKRLDVPYTFFRQQVTTGNVKEVNAKNDVIQGVFRTETK